MIRSFSLHDRHHGDGLAPRERHLVVSVDWGITIGTRAAFDRYAVHCFGWLLLMVGVNAAVAFIRARRTVRRTCSLMASNGMKIAIVGGGLAGLAAAMKIAEGGHAVDLFSVVPVKRSHSVCAQGGINGAVNTKGRRRFHLGTFRRHCLRRRLSRESTAGQSDVRNGAVDHLPVRPHGCSLLAHA
jgi:hypothetical protein